jgi:NAD(P)H-dependent flavin oxidoreductase YrpB (nitropropane dioxygenase family)
VLDLHRLMSPVVQAGMGLIARHELAAAVSEAGGLGTIAGTNLAIAAELAAARGITDRPIAVNLLVDSGPLYAGANAGRVTDIKRASELVAALTS